LWRFGLVCATVAFGIRQDPVNPTHDDFGSDRNVDSFGNSQLEPACSQIECGAMKCDAPFELKMDESCCGYCWAPHHIVPTTHRAFASEHTVEGCAEAPKFCSGPGPVVQCYKQPCEANEKLHCGPTDCCGKCVK